MIHFDKATNLTNTNQNQRTANDKQILNFVVFVFFNQHLH
jgi:hypothetical protein